MANMNVLIINASPRKKGITSTLLDEVKTVINPTYQIDTVRIQDLKITHSKFGKPDNKGGRGP